MPRFGADESFASTTSGGVFDSSGNPVISADNEFGGSPLGPAALAQTLFSVANGTFNLLPPDIDQPISNENPLPYWSAPADDSDGLMTAQVIFDTATNTYALRMTPGTAASGYTLSITTRSAVISDDNLALRQKAIATLEKVGTYAGTTQANLSLTATYYDHTGTQLSSQAIGTVYDNGTISSITGFTTAGTAAVGISAAYVDLTFTMTATANVTSGISFDINTILLQTSQGAGGGGGGFLIAETFTTSTTWTRPTGVDYATLVLVGGGGGGSSGGLISDPSVTTSPKNRGGGGGGGGGYLYLPNVYIGDSSTYTITIGAGGSGGTANVFTKASGGTAANAQPVRTGSNGGTTSFGTAHFAAGGGGSYPSGAGTVDIYGVGGTGGIFSSVLWGTQLLSLNGATGGTAATGTGNATPTIANTFVTGTWTQLPYQGAIAYPGAGSAGANGVLGFVGSAFTGGSAIGTGAPASGSGYFTQGGGAAGGYSVPASGFALTLGTPTPGQAGAGGAGGAVAVKTSNSGTVTYNGTAGNGGAAAGTSAAGGGGGGLVHFEASGTSGYNPKIVNLKSGAGGDGGQGYAIVITVQ
jgi:hypothetical protein